MAKPDHVLGFNDGPFSGISEICIRWKIDIYESVRFWS